ncbi:MAG: MBL fold metallo-hydrolase [Acidobacteria bacterium]|nr:MBL fold metallo-hydrolase [Acidobacteriota bacterium]
MNEDSDSNDETPAPVARPPKSEQEPASSELVEIAPNIVRMQLPIDMPGLGHVNCYILEDDRGLALVDPGLPDETSFRTLSDRLASFGASVQNVHTVIVTHSHPDHFGGYRHIANATDDVALITHESFRDRMKMDEMRENLDFDSLEPSTMTIEELREAFKRSTPWGKQFSPPDMALERFQRHGRESFASFRLPEPTQRVSDGTVIELAGREWVSVHTPGHTADHLCLYDPGEKVMLSGDHVLPSITPHIGGITPQQDPLAEFFNSLDRMHEFNDVELVLPAHGKLFSDLPGRADDIKEHHVERLDAIREIADEIGEADVNSYMQRLFRERSWGEMAESETYAHLEHLRIMGDAVAGESAGLRTYAPA